MSSSSTSSSLLDCVSVTLGFALEREMWMKPALLLQNTNTTLVNDSLFLFGLACHFLVSVLVQHVSIWHQVCLSSLYIWPIRAQEHYTSVCYKTIPLSDREWPLYRWLVLSSFSSSSAVDCPEAPGLKVHDSLTVCDWPTLPFPFHRLQKKYTYFNKLCMYKYLFICEYGSHLTIGFFYTLHISLGFLSPALWHRHLLCRRQQQQRSSLSINIKLNFWRSLLKMRMEFLTGKTGCRILTVNNTQQQQLNLQNKQVNL